MLFWMIESVRTTNTAWPHSLQNQPYGRFRKLENQMGEASKRRQRVAALAHLAVGPAGFPEPGTALLLLCRPDPDNLIRFCADLQDLTSNRKLISAVRKMDAASLSQASWVVVVLMDEGEGGVSLRLGSKEAETSDDLLNHYVSGFGARQLRWSALVWGSEADVEVMSARLAGLSLAIPSRNHAKPMPRVSIGQTRPPIMRIEISSSEVASGDLRATLFALDTLAIDERVLDRIDSSVLLSFEGYEADERFLGNVPEVVEFLRQVLEHAPWAMVLSHPSIYGLWCAALGVEFRSSVQEGGHHAGAITADKFEEVVRFISFTAADYWTSRLLEGQPMHPALATCAENWRAYLTDSITEPETHIEEALAGIQPVANESDFWASIQNTIAPGWVTDFQATADAPTPTFAGREVFVYALDPKTGRVYGAGFTVEEVRAIQRINSIPGLADCAPSAAITHIRAVAEDQSPPSDPRARVAILAACAALGSTQLFTQVVKTNGSFVGHFLYMIYTPKSGDPFARSVYFDQPKGARPAPLDQLYSLAAATIAKDIDSPQGYVGSTIKRGGGLLLSDFLDASVKLARVG